MAELRFERQQSDFRVRVLNLHALWLIVCPKDNNSIIITITPTAIASTRYVSDILRGASQNLKMYSLQPSDVGILISQKRKLRFWKASGLSPRSHGKWESVDANWGPCDSKSCALSPLGPDWLVRILSLVISTLSPFKGPLLCSPSPRHSLCPRTPEPLRQTSFGTFPSDPPSEHWWAPAPSTAVLGHRGPSLGD